MTFDELEDCRNNNVLQMMDAGDNAVVLSITVYSLHILDSRVNCA